MTGLLHDLRYGLRTLRMSPGFSATVVTTLALVIGVNTAVFTLVNKAVLAPWPFADAERLVNFFRMARDGSETRSVSYPDYIDYRDRSDVFEQLVVHSFIPANVDTGTGGSSRMGVVVSGNYFTTLGIEPAYGRLLTPEDNRTAGAHPYVVLSHGFWQRTFAGNPAAIGKTILIGAHPFTIVGVAPQRFAGTTPVLTPDFWAPLAMIGQIRLEDRELLEQRRSGFLLAFGKLKPGLTLEQAQARLEVTAGQLEEIDPERYADECAVLVPARGILPMTPNIRRIALGLSTLVMIAVGLVLIVGCANVANLLLARSIVRRRQVGICMAVGAPRWRVVRQLLCESLVLAAIGGTAGLLLATWTLDVLVAILPSLPFNLTVDLDFGVDWRVLCFTAAVSIGAGLVFGMLPALNITRVDLATTLKTDSAAGAGGVKRSRLRNALVVAQVSASLVLLIVAGLFIRSLSQARAIAPGFEHRNVLAVMLDLGALDYDAAKSVSFYQELLERVRALPGVTSASIEDCPPLTITMSSAEYWIEGYRDPETDDSRVSVAFSTISTENFKTLGIPLLLGRDFSERDEAGAPRVAIVNRAFVDRYWPGQDPIGKHISTTGPEENLREVVGVTATIKHWSIGEEPRPYIYLPLMQGPEQSFSTLLVRASDDPLAAAAPVQSILRDLDRNLAPVETCRLSDKIGFMLLPDKFAAAGFGMFGVLAMVLASVGLYGVMAYAVSQRTREIGIRTTLGAQRGDILRLTMRQGIILTTIGVIIGLIIALATTRLLSSLLYDVGTTDPLTFVGVSLLLLLVAILAMYVPARRATKIDPMAALRCE